MSLKGQYNNALLKDLLLQELKKGVVPNVDELKAQLDALAEVKPLVGTKPLVSLENHQLTHYENSSAAKWNSTMTSARRDLEVMHGLISSLRKQTIGQARRWSAHWASVKRLMDDLEDRIDNILLIKRDTLGYYKYVTDNFKSVDLTDLSTTTAKVDTTAGVVGMQELTTNANLDLSNANVSRTTIQAPGLVSVDTSVNGSVENVLSDQYSQWLEIVRGSNMGSVTVALDINLGSLQTFSKAIFTPAGSTATSAYVVTMLYSQDGVDYLVVPNDSSQSLTTNPGVWVFEEISARKIRFLISKNGYDDIDANNNYGYIIGAKNVSLYKPGFSLETTSVWESVSRSVLDDDGNAINFSKCALNVCWSVPSTTSIDFYVSVDNGNTYLAISPIEDSNPGHPQVIDFAEAILANNINQSTIWDNSISSAGLDPANTANLSLETPSDMVLNYYIPQANVSSVRESTYEVWRNLGQSGIDVRGIASGWFRDTNRGTWKTWFKVDDPNGITIELGSTSAWLDQTLVTGAVWVSQGMHQWETNFENWLSVDSGLTTQAALELADSLYPHNHKLLIEGYDYGSSFTGEQVYTGMSWWAESKLTYTPLHEFFGVTNGMLDVYTRQTDLNGNLGFIIKADQSFGDHTNEQFRVNYELTDRLFSSITLKAVLSTNSASTSPILDSYTLRLG